MKRDAGHQGSRRHLLDLLDMPDWHRRLTPLIEDAPGRLSADAARAPEGTSRAAEWTLARFCKAHCADRMDAGRLAAWWVTDGTAPTWDLLATCRIDGAPGLLMVEAKAHAAEMHFAGKPVRGGAADAAAWTRLDRGPARSLINHGYIGRCIHEARDALRAHFPGIGIDRDICYQLSNRIASAWKVADCGMPAVLLYLGFTGDAGMAPVGAPLRDDKDWQRVVDCHLRKVGAEDLPTRDATLANGCALRFRIGCLPALRQSTVSGRAPGRISARRD